MKSSGNINKNRIWYYILGVLFLGFGIGVLVMVVTQKTTTEVWGIIAPIIFIVIGAWMLIAGAIKDIGRKVKKTPTLKPKKFKKQSLYSDIYDSVSGTPTLSSDEKEEEMITDAYEAFNSSHFDEDISNFKKFSYYPTKKFGRSFAIKNEDGNVIYDISLRKRGPFSSYKYDFKNLLTGETSFHKRGLSMSIGGGAHNMMIGDITFKLDGEEVWDVLVAKGITIMFGGASNRYKVLYNNKIVGLIERPCNNYAEGRLSYREVIEMYMHRTDYKFECLDENLDVVVLCTFIMAQISYVTQR